MKDFVVITKAKPMNYLTDYVRLPKTYGSKKYYQREDIKAIETAVHQNLSTLNKQSNFLSELQNKKVILKPNLVSVFHKFGFEKNSYPESTDPRVIDAIVKFLKPHTKELVIAESSGIGMPTRLSFKIAGLHRLSKRHNIQLIALEEQPVDRYILPKAQVMKEVLIPKLFSEVVAGEAYFISVPKMKTNLYTKVTLGFKNAMGIIPYNLRLRNHNYLINEKIVDMLYILKPNLVIVDGIIGGEGNTPAPVDPVESEVIVSGTNCVETDRITTKIMGFDPKEIKLITHATKLGFGNPEVKIIGEISPKKFRAADQRLDSETFREDYPNIEILVGKQGNQKSDFASTDEVTQETITKMINCCTGGCKSSFRTALDNTKYQGHKTDFELIVIFGAGIKIGDAKYYYNQKGEALTEEAISRLPGKKIAIGTCTKSLTIGIDLQIMGCMPRPIEPILELYKLLGIPNHNKNPLKNNFFIAYIIAKLRQVRKRRKLLRKGIWLDCLPSENDTLHQVRALLPKEEKSDYIAWPLPEMRKQQQKLFLAQEKILE